jgi:hypothetical protein
MAEPGKSEPCPVSAVVGLSDEGRDLIRLVGHFEMTVKVTGLPPGKPNELHQ